MYYNRRKMLVSILWVITGAALIILTMNGTIDDPVYCGMGGGFLAVGILQICRNLKYHSDAEYKEKIDIEFSDERNRYIRMKAWSYAGYLFIIGAAVISIVLFVMKQTSYGQILSYCMCAVLVFYWVSYMLLQKKN